MKLKAAVTFSFLSMLYLCVVGRALYIQVINKDKLVSYSKSQIVREAKIYPKRGHIIDRNHNPLAINVVRYDLFTFAKNRKRLQKEIRQLKKIIPSINRKKLSKKIESRKKFTWIGRKLELNEEQVAKIKKFKSIHIEAISSRFYPNNELLSQSLGFVGIDNDGLAGIEYYFNDELKGEAEVFKYFKDAKGRPVKFKSRNFQRRAKDITLSIDTEIQASVEQYLKEGVEKHEALKGGAAVMDARTGEIWAMANYPSFDPNKIKRGDITRLPFITDPIEPGSVMKTITVAAALEKKTVKSDTNFYCESGRYRIGKHVIKESDNDHAFEWLSVADILRYSSNIGTTKIAFDLGQDKLRESFKEFNFGSKTGVEISGESRGIMPSGKKISPIKLSNISFGQGMAVTGIQMLSAYSAFANGGHYVKPTILKVDDPKKIESKRIISRDTANTVTSMLIDAVEDGTGSNADIAHFRIAGKTSTAQRPDEKGGYSGYISGFLGYPVGTEKRFVVFVYIDKPEKGYYGNAVAAPIFKKIVEKILYKNKAYTKLAKLNPSKRKAFDKLNIKYSALKRKVEKGKIPNLKGLDKKSATKLLNRLKIEFDSNGFGIVHKQFPAPGTTLGKNTKVKLIFKAPRL